MELITNTCMNTNIRTLQKLPSDTAIIVRNTTTSTKLMRLQLEQVMYGFVWKTLFLSGSLVLYPLGSNLRSKLFEVEDVDVDPSRDFSDPVLLRQW